MTRLAYDSDITNEQWDILKPFFEKRHPLGWGRPRTVDTREVINAVFYCNKTGCQFRSLPHDFPKWFIVYYHYRKWQKNGTWEESNRALVAKCREAVGRDPENPTIACIDSQSIKGSSESGGACSGFDGNKKVKGRKRHIVTESMGYILGAKVHSANEADTKMAPELVISVFMRFVLISVLFADLGYQRPFIEYVKKTFGIEVEVTKKESGFKVSRKRWVVERTFAWITRQRRMTRDYERTIESSENMIYISMVRIMLKQLCPVPQPWRNGEKWSPLYSKV